MSLRPQDIVCSLKILSHQLKGPDHTSWSFSELADSLFLSKGETFNAVKRALAAGLINAAGDKVTVAPKKLLEFLIYGMPTAYYPIRGSVGRGMVTAFSATNVFGGKVAPPAIPMVWLHESTGKVQGESLIPLYPTVPAAASADAALYEMLVLCDAIRVGNHKERKVAEGMLEKILFSAKLV